MDTLIEYVGEQVSSGASGKELVYPLILYDNAIFSGIAAGLMHFHKFATRPNLAS